MMKMKWWPPGSELECGVPTKSSWDKKTQNERLYWMFTEWSKLSNIHLNTQKTINLNQKVHYQKNVCRIITSTRHSKNYNLKRWILNDELREMNGAENWKGRQNQQNCHIDIFRKILHSSIDRHQLQVRAFDKTTITRQWSIYDLYTALNSARCDTVTKMDRSSWK